ncbi:MAG: DNA polymerase III subunit gamma/tau [Pirellulaceae bacterium]
MSDDAFSTADTPDEPSPSDLAPESSPRSGQYVVVARRYRPQSFGELVGQKNVTQALGNAITTGRVGHAYLFTGARGVGKTSAARIFAKALDCVDGPSPAPCNACDICQSISVGDDVDVLEIDGASNRGIDEIRQLRSNVNIRPSRARYKIYIIDEVHMLTGPAFNALLKTLEEPPEHVKFIFCTTDPEKIPITVLSRCQRFDFAPVRTSEIVGRLEQIVEAEGRRAEPEALELLARRAAGSMRDSQSLLEQLLSYCGETVTVVDVHQMLGTASSGRLAELVEQLIARDPAQSLAAIDRAADEGVDLGQLAEQLLGYLRDMMAAAVGCDEQQMLHCGPGDFEPLQEAAGQWGLETTMAAAQILDDAIVRMRQSVHTRTLLEVAVVRICRLEDLDRLAAVVAELRSGGGGGSPNRAGPAPTMRPQARAIAPSAEASSSRPAAAPQSAENSPVAKQPSSEEAAPSPVEGNTPRLALDQGTLREVWRQALEMLGDMTADYASTATRVAISAPNRLVVSFPASYNYQKESCERVERRQRLEEALEAVTGKTVRLDFELLPQEKQSSPITAPSVSRRQLMQQTTRHPWVSEALEMFDGEIVRVEPGKPSRPPEDPGHEERSHDGPSAEDSGHDEPA